MAIRTILAPLSGGAASEGPVETACRLAKHFGAHLEALHVRSDPREVLPLRRCAFDAENHRFGGALRQINADRYPADARMVPVLT